MALMHSRLYVFGGAATACTDSTVYALDTKTLVWASFAKATGAAPTPREGAIWLALHERLLLFGGSSGLERLSHRVRAAQAQQLLLPGDATKLA